ncbi:MAG: ABC-F family ATP-binding cassette domain-containing protein [Bombilactobacillus mellifer]|nr:ABC-F family ATP-binding cassette domain-containing protein [Bombilactobacillus mellifer]
MSILQAKDLKKEFNNNIVFEHLNLKIEKHEKIGIVGPNGVGKSTLIKILANKLTADSGKITTSTNLKVAYLAQDALLNSENSIYEEMKQVFKDIIEIRNQAQILEKEISKLPKNDPKIPNLLLEYDKLTAQFEEEEGYEIDAKIRKILNGFNFPESRYQETITKLSGGEKSRLALAKILLQQPDLLFLDEPTNHLDLNTLIWLEDYLKSYHNALVIVSHDQYFLNEVTTKTLAFHHGNFKSYSGNYSFYLKESQKQDNELKKHFTEQQREIKKLTTFVEKNITRASTTKRAQSKRKQLEKMEIMTQPVGPDKTIHLNFPQVKRTGNIVLTTDNLAIGYDQNTLIDKISFKVKIGERVAIIGPNGRGKSTLVKTLIGQIPPVFGNYHFGSNVELGYYDQGFKQLQQNKKVIDQFWDKFPNLEKEEVLHKLASVLLTGDVLQLKVNQLSGGQKARLALIILIEQKANVLILDEPTNHLDIDSKEVLEKALIKFNGTVIFVSHDRFFINEIADKVIDLTLQGSTTYLGNWDYYYAKTHQLEKSKQTNKIKPKINNQNKSQSSPNLSSSLSFNEQKRLRKLKKESSNYEEIINKNEKQLALLQAEAAKPENGYNLEKLNDLTNEIEKTEKIIDDAMNFWEEISEEIEQFNQQHL